MNEQHAMHRLDRAQWEGSCAETRPLPFPLRPDCVESHDSVYSSILYEYYQLVSTCVLKMFEARQFEMK